jgi:Flp pilus assembly protein TadD
MTPPTFAALEQVASLYADVGATDKLASAVDALTRSSPDRAATFYYQAVVRLLNDDAAEARRLAERALAVDPQYAAGYDLLGAAHMKLAQLNEARAAFERSLQFNSHDSTAYTNLGLMELGVGNKAAAARYFAEAVWLDEHSKAARDGLAQATAP